MILLDPSCSPALFFLIRIIQESIQASSVHQLCQQRNGLLDGLARVCVKVLTSQQTVDWVSMDAAEVLEALVEDSLDVPSLPSLLPHLPVLVSRSISLSVMVLLL